MTRDEFAEKFMATETTHPNYAQDTLRRINNEVFARVAVLRLDDDQTAQAVADAFADGFADA